MWVGVCGGRKVEEVCGGRYGGKRGGIWREEMKFVI